MFSPDIIPKHEYDFCQLAFIKSVLDKRRVSGLYVGFQLLSFVREQTVNMFTEITYFLLRLSTKPWLCQSGCLTRPV